MYWGTETRYEKIANVMPINAFETIKRNIHVNKNAERPKDCTDKLYKIRPLIEGGINRFQLGSSPGGKAIQLTRSWRVCAIVTPMLGLPFVDGRGKHASRPHKMSDELRQRIRDPISSFRGRQSHYSQEKPDSIHIANALLHFPSFRIPEDELSAGTRWKKWIAKFENLVTALDITTDERKKALLIHFRGDEIFDLVDTFVEVKKETYDSLKAELELYFTPRILCKAELANTPSPATCAQMAYELGVITTIQLVERMLMQNGPICLSWDATTLDGANINEVL
ncbi:hypothetical protein EGW08_004865 [Elysia chlorotica]|uniref:PiggyBac transposable element-derived protein domain-containing protein n=1 Tax=Elysia chlorotica TaxID=188477 RepID=A0A433U0N9_ELYCH|nr:hypothetical protein EGW08_004865 [Elysia chlorotica]